MRNNFIYCVRSVILRIILLGIMIYGDLLDENLNKIKKHRFLISR